MDGSQALEATAPVQVIQTSAGPVAIDPQGIIRQTFTIPCVQLEHMQEIFDAMRRLGGSTRRWRVLVDARALRWGSASARRFGAARELGALVRAQALLIGSPVSQMLAGFFVRVSRPPFPTRVFASESLALDWLQAADHGDRSP